MTIPKIETPKKIIERIDNNEFKISFLIFPCSLAVSYSSTETNSSTVILNI